MGASGGGLKGYAEKIGKDKGNVALYRNGATVLKSIRSNITSNESVLEKVQGE